MRALLCAVLAMAYADAGGQAPAAPNIERSPEWNELLEDVLRQFPALHDAKGLQVLTIPQEANWDDPKYGDFYAWQVLGNTIPAWGSTYAPTAKRVTDAYFTFITNLDIAQANPKDTAAAVRARDDYLHYHDQEDVLLRDPTSYTNGVLRPQAKVQLAQVAKAANAAASRYTTSLSKSLHGYTAAAHLLLDFDNPAFQREALSPDGLRLPYRTFVITPDLSTWIKEAGTVEVRPISRVRVIHHYLLQRVPGAYPPLREPGDPHYDPTMPSYGPFITFEKQLAESPEDVARLITEATVSARRVGVFTVTPGPWMNADAIQAFKAGPFIDGPVKAGTVALWGATGAFNLLPTQVIVAYDPNITITVPAESFKRVAAALQRQHTITVGPFGFGGASPPAVELDEGKSQIYLRNSSPRPYVIAIISRILPDFQ